MNILAFAAGHVAASGDAMTIVATSRQEPWLEETLKAVAGGKPVEETKPYAPRGKAPIVLPLGPKRGNAFLTALAAGNWITSKMKGKDLFLSKYYELFGRA